MNRTAVETYPPAKLNLFLELLGRRPDGYHELETVMVAIGRRDRMRVSLEASPPAAERPIQLVCRWLPGDSIWNARLRDARRRTGGSMRSGQQTSIEQPGDEPPDEREDDWHPLSIPADDRNLVVRALQQFRERFAIDAAFRVQLDKLIPAGAGMGGASSDAAAALRAAAMLTGIDLGDDRLRELATQLGSDVPFFLGESARSDAPTGRPIFAAVASGRGTTLRPIPIGARWHFVVLYPPEAISTAECYAHSQIPENPEPCESLVGALRSGDRAVLTNTLHNRLAASAQRLSPWIETALTGIRQAGLEGVTMTGSGSACFGIARSTGAAARAASRLMSRRLGVCFVATPAALPAAVRWVD